MSYKHVKVAHITQRARQRPDSSAHLNHIGTRQVVSQYGEIKDQVLDSSRARERLGWTPAYTLDAGLKETIAWYEQYLGSA